PIYDSMKIEGSKIRLTFKNAQSLHAKDDKPATGFAIAGEDQKWHWASAKLDGESVIVFSEDVPNPKAVRYAWGDDPIVNLVNAADLPMQPFRTDDWKISTADAK